MENPSSYDRFTELLQTCHTQLFGYLYALAHDIHDAEDLYQKTCLILWQKFDGFREGTSFFHWAKSVAGYQAMNLLRERKHRKAMFSEAFQGELAAVWEEVEAETWEARRQALRHCVEKLPANDRQLVELCLGSNQPLHMIAERLSRPAKSIYDAMGRIRRALLNCIEVTLIKEGM